MRSLRTFLLAVSFSCVLVEPAAAEPLDLSVTTSVNFLEGYHFEGNSEYRVAFAPLPLVALDARYRHVDAHVESLPPVTFGYTGNPQGIASTRLSLITATARYVFGDGTYVGAGTTVYNQATNRGSSDDGTFFRSEEDSSRVTGARFEIGNRRRVGSKLTLESVFALNPVMHGVEREMLTTTYIEPPPFGGQFTFQCVESFVRGYVECLSTRQRPAGLAERASQIDTGATLTRPLGRGYLSIGVRYLNYGASYQFSGNVANNILADRNAGFMPLISYRYRFR